MTRLRKCGDWGYEDHSLDPTFFERYKNMLQLALGLSLVGGHHPTIGKE